MDGEEMLGEMTEETVFKYYGEYWEMAPVGHDPLKGLVGSDIRDAEKLFANIDKALEKFYQVTNQTQRTNWCRFHGFVHDVKGKGPTEAVFTKPWRRDAVARVMRAHMRAYPEFYLGIMSWTVSEGVRGRTGGRKTGTVKVKTGGS
jgi:hypothetical protein